MSCCANILHSARSDHRIGSSVLGEALQLGTGHHQLAFGEGRPLGLDRYRWRAGKEGVSDEACRHGDRGERQDQLESPDPAGMPLGAHEGVGARRVSSPMAGIAKLA